MGWLLSNTNDILEDTALAGVEIRLLPDSTQVLEVPRVLSITVVGARKRGIVNILKNAGG